ncbi:MAG TPA: O-antigen ligase family protein [Solirubrobacterales bacterium]|nr:O-antigen ligase family protein [Solirubrobacterales bacterium]
MSEALEIAGCLAAAASVSAALLVSDARVRAAALLAAMGLAAALVAGQGWDELASLRAHHLELAGVIIGAVAVLVALAAAMVRWPILLPLLVIATLPFRIRLHVAGGQAVNLLVPLYAVIGAGVLAIAFEALRGRAARMRALPKPLVLALVLVICLYALQATYSSDLDFAARNIGFFMTPFAVLFCLLAMAEWDRRLLRLAIGVFLLEAILFAGIGIGQYATEHIFWNGKLEASNDFHFYFRVNSLFWDPNIYGRYLMVAILLVCAALLWTSDRRVAFVLVSALAIIFAGLVFSFSQTTFASLFVGLAVLAALRWSVGWVAVGASVALAATVLAVFFAAGGSNESSRDISEGHSSLISGGAKLAGHRPIYGYGSASFSKEFAQAENVPPGDTTISHTEPITVAAEQGVIGIAAYLALLAAALWTFFSGIRSIAPGLRGRFRSLEEGDRVELIPARIGLAAAFVALLGHTIGYAAYLTDPLTWALLAVGGVLAAEVGAGGWPRRTAEGEAKSAPAPTVA